MICHKPDLNQDWWGSWCLPSSFLFFLIWQNFLIFFFSDLLTSYWHKISPSVPQTLLLHQDEVRGERQLSQQKCSHCPSGNTEKSPSSWYDSELVVEKGQTRLQQQRTPSKTCIQRDSCYHMVEMWLFANILRRSQFLSSTQATSSSSSRASCYLHVLVRIGISHDTNFNPSR